MKSLIKSIFEQTVKKNPSELEFHQAVKEVLESIELVVDKHPEYVDASILERILEPERAIMFRVPWIDDKGNVQVNRGFRVEFNKQPVHYNSRRTGIRFDKIDVPVHLVRGMMVYVYHESAVTVSYLLIGPRRCRSIDRENHIRA